jgi:hypothetical protein
VNFGSCYYKIGNMLYESLGSSLILDMYVIIRVR